MSHPARTATQHGRLIHRELVRSDSVTAAGLPACCVSARLIGERLAGSMLSVPCRPQNISRALPVRPPTMHFSSILTICYPQTGSDETPHECRAPSDLILGFSFALFCLRLSHRASRSRILFTGIPGLMHADASLGDSSRAAELHLRCVIV